jgi:hypothetical protein
MMETGLVPEETAMMEQGEILWLDGPEEATLTTGTLLAEVIRTEELGLEEAVQSGARKPFHHVQTTR